MLRDEPTFKCSRCSHIFSYDGDVTPASSGVPPAEAGRPSSGANESLSFSFGGTAAAEEPRRPPMDSPPPPPEADQPEAADEVEGETEDHFAFDEDDEPVRHHERMDERYPEEDEHRAEEEPRFVRGEDELRIEREIVQRTGRPWLMFLLFLACVYASFAVYLRNHPESATAFFGAIPMAGHLLMEDRLLQTRIVLDDVEGFYQKIKDDRLVFIVSGRAINTSPQPLKGVQIESTLYGPEGQSLDTKSIFCGNALSLKIVRDLSSKEISLLQRLEPPQRFEIRPGESAGFTVVFMTPPNGMREFGTRVVGAQQALS